MEKELTILGYTNYNIADIVDDAKKALKKMGAEIVEEKDLGERRLAYPQRGAEYANYYVIVFKTKAELYRLCNHFGRDKARVVNYLIINGRLNSR